MLVLAQKLGKILTDRIRIFTPGDTLSQKVSRGSFWVFLSRGLQQFTGIIKVVILARLIGPTEFGLMGIALIFVSVTEIFSNPGLSVALIQREGNISDYLDTAWVVSVLRGIASSFLIFVLAPWAALFFGNPSIVSVLRTLSLVFLVRGFTNIGTVYFSKDLDFKKMFWINSADASASFAIAIALALILKNVWALVYSTLIGETIRCILSYSLHPFRPKFQFCWARVKGLMRFSRWVWGKNVIILFLSQIDSAIIGKTLGTTSLGLYQMAYRMSNIPATEFTHIVSEVLFPLYSKLQSNEQMLRRVLINSLKIICCVSISFGILVFLLSQPFVQIILGDKWRATVPVTQILCIYGVTRSINAALGSFLQGIGKPHLLAITSFAQLVMVGLIIYPLTLNFGIFGTSLAIIIPNSLVLFFLSQSTMKTLNLGYSIFLKILLLPLLVAGFSFLITSILFHFSYWQPRGILSLLFLTLLIVVVILTMFSLLDKILKYDLRPTLRLVRESL